MKKSRSNTPAYDWGYRCKAWPLLDTPNLSVKEEMMPAGTAERAHYHERSQQFFYILEGEADFFVAGQKVQLGVGEGLHIKAKQEHYITNPADQALRFLVISQPNIGRDRFDAREKFDGIHQA